MKEKTLPFLINLLWVKLNFIPFPDGPRKDANQLRTNSARHQYSTILESEGEVKETQGEGNKDQSLPLHPGPGSSRECRKNATCPKAALPRFISKPSHREEIFTTWVSD